MLAQIQPERFRFFIDSQTNKVADRPKKEEGRCACKSHGKAHALQLVEELRAAPGQRNQLSINPAGCADLLIDMDVRQKPEHEHSEHAAHPVHAEHIERIIVAS